MAETIQDGVTVNYDIEFGLCLTGRPENIETAEYTTVKDTEGISISIDGTTEEWNPMDAKGWTRRLVTGKSIGVSFSGKRNYGDAGSDYVAGLALKTGKECNNVLQIRFPNGDKLYIPCIINVTNVGSGDSTALSALEWEIQSDGKPTYTSYETV